MGQGNSLLAEFQNADHAGKMRLVSDAVTGKRSASQDDVRALLTAAIKDPDASVRVNAVDSVVSILALSSMPQAPPGQEWAVKLRPVADSLGPALEEAARDPEPRVRVKALTAIAAPIAYANPGRPLPKELVNRLADVFDSDASAQVRAFALQSMAWSYRSEDPDIRKRTTAVLLKALADPDQYVVQSAGLAAAQAKIPEALPLLVKQLSNPSHIARMGVAQGIAGFGSAALRYLPELERALAAETDDITRKTIAGTISVIKRIPDSVLR